VAEEGQLAIRYLAAPPRTAELVIIGGGIVGAATTFHAARAGLRPLLLERRAALCSLTTAVAAGGFRLQMETREQLELVRESAELFLHFAELTGQRGLDPGVRQQGYLWLTTSAEGAERQRRLVERQRGWGVGDVELLDGDEARRAFPFVAPEVVQARFRAADGLLDPKAITMGLAAASGTEAVVGCEVVGIGVRGGRVVEVRTTLGDVAAGAVVVAAGPFSGEVARLAGVELPVTTVRRQKLVMPEVPRVPRDAPMTIDDDTGVHWRPAFLGASLLFAEPEEPPSAPTEDVPVDHRFAFRLLDPASPVSAGRVTPFWREVWADGAAPWMLQAGHYTMTPDHRPLIGQVEVEGLLVNTGYSGRGVMAGPAGSRRLVDLLTGKLSPADNALRPDRHFDAEPAVDIL
jgi:sarcosine oxidase, subunit beta